MSSSHYTLLPALRHSPRAHRPPVRLTDEAIPAGLPGIPHGKAAQIIAATPRGHRVTRDPDRWLVALRRDPAVVAMRVDGRDSLLAVAVALASSWQYEGGVLRPGNGVLADRSGRAQRTVQRYIRWLRERLYIGWVQHGSTEAERGQDHRGNLTNEFVLLTGAPKRVSYQKHSYPHSRAREARHSPAGDRRIQSRNPAPNGASGQQGKSPAPNGAWVPQTRRDRLTAAIELRRRMVGFPGLTPRQIRHVARPFWQAGWTINDVQYAVDHRPDGTTHPHDDGVRAPARWLAYRLGYWLDHDGLPQTSKSERSAEIRRRRDERLRSTAAPKEPPLSERPHVRAMLAEFRRDLADRRRRSRYTPEWRGGAETTGDDSG